MLLSEVSGITPIERRYQPSERFVNPTCTVGIELELEQIQGNIVHGCGDPVVRTLWSQQEDGSLRNHGAEFITPPIFGEDIISAVNSLPRMLRGIPYVISYRCGLHIHIDVSSHTREQLLAHCVAYALVEDALYSYVGEERRQNIYCLPLSGTNNIVPFLNDLKYGRNPDSVRDIIARTSKYSGFNILPVLRQGSVEYRHHPATVDPDAIINWINVVMRIREASLNFTAQDLAAMKYEEVSNVLIHNAIPYTFENWRRGFLTAKDILNINQISEMWEKIRAKFSDDTLKFTLTEGDED